MTSPGSSSLDDRHRPAELLGVRHPVLDRPERPAVEEVGRMHGVAGAAQLVGEPADPVRDPERMVEDDDFSHLPEALTRPT